MATVIHYYEAWLATLAIAVWHFYWVMFNPSVYPMSLVWWRGYLSEEAMAHEHPLELNEIREAATAARPEASAGPGSDRNEDGTLDAEEGSG